LRKEGLFIALIFAGGLTEETDERWGGERDQNRGAKGNLKIGGAGKIYGLRVAERNCSSWRPGSDKKRKGR